MEEDHEGDEPEPEDVVFGEKAKEDDEEADGNRHQRKVVGADPVWDFGYHPINKFSFGFGEDGCAYFFVSSKICHNICMVGGS